MGPAVAVGCAAIALLRQAHLRAVVHDGRAGQRELAQRRQPQPPLVALHQPQEAVHVVIVQETGADKARVKVRFVSRDERIQFRQAHVPEGEGPAQVVGQQEIQAPIQTGLIRPQQPAALHNLAEDERLGVGVLHRQAEIGPKVVRRAVGVVQPIPIHPELANPVPRHVQHIPAGGRVLVVPLRQRLHAEERFVLIGPAAEGEPVAVGAIRLGLGADEERVRVGHVIGDEVQDNADAARVGRLHKGAEIGLRPQARLNGVQVGGVVPVVRRAGEDGRKPDGRRAQRRDVVQFLRNAAQGAAVEAAQVARFGEGAARARVEAVHENVVDDGFPGPRGRLGVGHGEREPRRGLGVRRAVVGEGAALPDGIAGLNFVAHLRAIGQRGQFRLPPGHVIPQERHPLGLHPLHGERVAVGCLAARALRLRAVGGVVQVRGVGGDRRPRRGVQGNRLAGRGRRRLYAVAVVHAPQLPGQFCDDLVGKR